MQIKQTLPEDISELINNDLEFDLSYLLTPCQNAHKEWILSIGQERLFVNYDLLLPLLRW